MNNTKELFGNQRAPDGHVYVCGACGRVSRWKHGFDLNGVWFGTRRLEVRILSPRRSNCGGCRLAVRTQDCGSWYGGSNPLIHPAHLLVAQLEERPAPIGKAAGPTPAEETQLLSRLFDLANTCSREGTARSGWACGENRRARTSPRLRS